MHLARRGVQKSAGCGVSVTSVTRIAATRDHLGRGPPVSGRRNVAAVRRVIQHSQMEGMAL
jgi:hypothetical protein